MDMIWDLLLLHLSHRIYIFHFVARAACACSKRKGKHMRSVKVCVHACACVVVFLPCLLQAEINSRKMEAKKRGLCDSREAGLAGR